MMKTQTFTSHPGRRLALLATLTLAATALALPALADNDGDADEGYGYGAGQTRLYGGHYRHGDRHRYNRYAWLNRTNRYGVRGRIVAWGRGPLQGCFRVKRTGRYRREPAIVTVRYCLDGYDQPYRVRRSKQLVRYLGYYRRTGGYARRGSMGAY